VDLVDRVYHARAANLNFTGASEDARKTINAWVEEKTFRKIN
jgi:serine protease inhibitor